jgi:maltose alpha-D-glucosyltransferase/alpha-amylase
MLLAEANMWPEDVRAYFGDGDECHMAYHFPMMPRLYMSIAMEDRHPLVEIMAQTPPIPANCQWAIFLRNHDELTLEMVTDRERDYMYRIFADDPRMRVNVGIRRRLAPLMEGSRPKIELLTFLLMTMPGAPILYYGDEIGMGDNIYLGDRNGVRTPMQWSPDRNAGFSRANPQKLYLPVVVDPEFHYEAVNVMAQQTNQYSLLWWMKRLIELRKRTRAFGRGSVKFLYPENSHVLAFIRHYEETRILVVANLSRLAQYVELDLSEFLGMVPMEMLSGVEFPPVGELPYLLTLGPHAFFWFALEPHPARLETLAATERGDRLPTFTFRGKWHNFFETGGKEALEELLPDYLRESRWFGGKARRMNKVSVLEAVPVNADSLLAYITFLRVEYTDGDPEIYQLPISATADERVIEAILRDRPKSLIARLEPREGQRRLVLYDAISEKAFGSALLQAIARRRTLRGGQGELAAQPSAGFRKAAAKEAALLEPEAMRAEQSNTSINFGDRFILKLFRRLEEGVNPDLEIGQFLTERTGFRNIAQVGGALEYRPANGELPPMTLGILQEYVDNEGDAWRYTVHSIAEYFERAITHTLSESVLPPGREHLMNLVDREIPAMAGDLIGPYLDLARLLGQRTAEMHLALAAAGDDPRFKSEPFSLLYQRSLYQTMRNRTGQLAQLLRVKLPDLPEGVRDAARRILEVRGDIIRKFRSLLDHKLTATRIRIHGDYHLGQVLFTGKDFVIIDFEGEPTRPLSERRFKRSPLRDVAGMLRSFDYALHSAIRSETGRGVRGWRDVPELDAWASFWYVWVGVAFLKAYMERAAGAAFLPPFRGEVNLLLEIFMLEKAVYELQYELNNRPDWVNIPVAGILDLLREHE